MVMLASLVLSCGCGPKGRSGLIPVSGTVTLDGTPLAQGVIVFEPESSEEAVVNAAVAIENGQYQSPDNGGLLPGVYRVSISSTPAAQPASDPVKAMEQASEPTAPDPIPPKYNKKSELQATVSADKPAQFDFDLKTK